MEWYHYLIIVTFILMVASPAWFFSKVEKFIFNSEYVGNTVSSTIPISMKKLLEQKAISHDEKIILAGFGVGLSYGATFITIEDI